ncbi:7,8-dihydropterin-6-yl-methyl-4-(beta-D-ribofuranosyl)aminobenzene 5'-phosphate synthase [Paenibacillus sp. DS2015]|uniref:MBL fold metallo-hydrolase n=1 Tax=Paenibacillus sp. DS2015 TaxID=3373917 RepID=UPI003D1FEA0B
MQIKVLVENTTISSQYRSKHGLCVYIETQKHKILFDLGSDQLFLENASKLSVDIEDIDIVVISHGHKDHGGALRIFLQHNSKAKIYIHQLAFQEYYTSVIGFKYYIGLDRSLANNDRFILIEDDYIIDDELQLFSNIQEHELCSKSNDSLYIKTNGKYLQDTFLHEQNLIITADNTKVLVAGCAHNGIVNILNNAEQCCDSDMDVVISGFHLFNPVSRKSESEELIKGIANQLSTKQTQFFTCHCTGKKAYHMLKTMMGDNLMYLPTGSCLEI